MTREHWTVTLVLDPESTSAVPMPNRVRSILKHALRTLRLKNQLASEVAGQWTITFERAGTILGEPLSQRVGRLVDSAWVYGLKVVGLKGVHADGTPVQVGELSDNLIAKGIP
jgi:hypothetical protein